MQEDIFNMSLKEVERVTVIQQVIDKKLKQREACERLGLSARQVKRLVKRYRREGAIGLVSKRRGRVSNRQCSVLHKEQIKAWVSQEYADFGPTLAAEKLYERQGLRINRETLRQWMVEWELWKAKPQKQVVIHQRRDRRACFGELIQIDGSPHDWFEGRREKCCLLVFIDDATSEVMEMRFEERETTAGYFRALRAYIERYGLPLAFYSDQFGVFRVNQREVTTVGETQFGRACKELGIELICANSPQAKGRVERVNSTLQDRLVKELRLRGIDDIETANAFLADYRVAHNQRFKVKARSEVDGHRQVLLDPEALSRVLSFQHERTLSKNLELSFRQVIYQIQTKTTGYRLRYTKVTVCEGLAGEITIVQQGKVLPYSRQEKQKRLTPVVNRKDLSQVMDTLAKRERSAVASVHKPKATHPWVQATDLAALKKKTRPKHRVESQRDACSPIQIFGKKVVPLGEEAVSPSMKHLALFAKEDRYFLQKGDISKLLGR